MTAGYLDLLCDAGATFSVVLTYRDSAGALVNLTGYTARMKVKRRYSDASGAAVLDLTTENGGIALGGAAGTITVTASATATAALGGGEYLDGTPPAQVFYYDLEIVSGSTVTRLVHGKFTVRAEVTN